MRLLTSHRLDSPAIGITTVDIEVATDIAIDAVAMLVHTVTREMVNFCYIELLLEK